MYTSKICRPFTRSCMINFHTTSVLAGPMGVMGGAVLSPDPRMNQSLNGSTGKQQHQQSKSSRSSSHHGGLGKKKSSPIPASHGASGTIKDLFVLVAAEAMPLGSAGKEGIIYNTKTIISFLQLAMECIEYIVILCCSTS